MAKQEKKTSIEIVKVDRGRINYCILGTTPIILNRMSEKGMRELLLPKGKKTAADKAQTLKHDPYQEFLNSPYINQDPKSPTLVQALSAWFKKGISNAALDVPGSSKAQIGRLLWVEGERLPLYGTPMLKMDTVRSADMNRTPDIRTRAALKEWACFISISYVKPMLNDTSITNLLVSAGLTQGVAEWRTGKGSGTFGSYQIVNQDDKTYQRILKEGRKVQVDAMDDPGFYDEETEQLYHWYLSEVKMRGREKEVSSNGKSRHRTVLTSK